MQPELPVQRQGPVRLARRRNRDGLALLVIGRLGVGDYDIEPVHRAAQQNDDQTRRALIGHCRPGIGTEIEGSCCRPCDEIAPVHRSPYRRMKSGLPRISAARSPLDDSSMAARVPSLMVEPKTASRCAASAAPGLPRTNAVAKLMRRVVASGLSQASSVFLYPSGVKQPKSGIPSWSMAPSSGRTLPSGTPAARTAEITNW